MAADPIKKRAKAHTRYYLADGTQVPGVTTVCGVLRKPALERWNNLMGLQGIDTSKYTAIAADVGELTHHMVMCDLMGKTPDVSGYSQKDIDLAENGYIKFLNWKKKHTIEPIFMEQPLISEKYKYGGTPDFYGKIDGAHTLADFKTGKDIYLEMLIQLSAYEKILEEREKPVDEMRIVRIGRDESEGFDERTFGALPRHWEMFLHCLAIYELRRMVA